MTTFPSAEAFLPLPKFNAGGQLCFLHVPKSAGTSVRLTMENAFDGDRVFPTGSAAFRGDYLQVTAGIEAGDDVRSFDALYGHFGWQAAQYLRSGANLFTWVREPRDRIISQFFFSVVQLRAPRFAAFVKRLDRGERLETVFIDWAQSVAGRPFQALVTGGPGYKNWRNANPHTKLHDAAVEALRSCFFIGLMEDHERSLDGLCALATILPPRQAIKRNVGTRRSRGLSLTDSELKRFDDIMEPQIALYERVVQVYQLQMEYLRMSARDNPAVGLIGDREALRQHILRAPKQVALRKRTQWNAWDAVQGENLDGREQHILANGEIKRWRWTGSTADTYIYLAGPYEPFEIRLRLYRATPVRNAKGAELSISGNPIKLVFERKPKGDMHLVGQVSDEVAKALPEIVELHIHTPSMLDERDLISGSGTRTLGLAIEGISIFSMTTPQKISASHRPS